MLPARFAKISFLHTDRVSRFLAYAGSTSFFEEHGVEGGLEKHRRRPGLRDASEGCTCISSY
jgi:hypothetical protein